MKNINPLLLKNKLLPSFSSLQVDHIVPAIKNAVNNCYKIIDYIIRNNNYNWYDLYQPLAEAENNLDYIWSVIDLMYSVKNNYQFRESYKTSLLLLNNYKNQVMQNKQLYDAYCKLRINDKFEKLNYLQKKTINNIIRDFHLSGILLSKEKKKEYIKITNQLSELSILYDNNLFDSTLAWNKIVTNKDELFGIPEEFLLIANNNALKNNKKGWLFTLDISTSYLPILTYCDNEKLREEIYYAYNTRASDQGVNAGKWDNGPIVNEILLLRHNLAKLLGYNSYLEYSSQNKMANTPKKIISFLKKINNCLNTDGKKKLLELSKFVKKKFLKKILNPWDIIFYNEKQKKYLFNIDEEKIKEFFPEEYVITGLFKIIRLIYGVVIQERKDKIDVWDKNVRFFDVFNLNNDYYYGSFYLDLYTRNDKKDGAWMNICTNMIKKIDGTLQKPIAYLICNFSPPVKYKNSLLTHNEVVTLFHEMGHVLHHILTNIDIPRISGINGVPWDVVELHSKFMENFCWDFNSLSLISKHYKSGDKLFKNNLLNNFIKSTNHNISIYILYQLELSLFDVYIHNQYKRYKYSAINNVSNILKKVKKEINLFPYFSWNRFPNTFSHIFSGGYAANYYGYLWSDMLATDIWCFFKKYGVLNNKVGRMFLTKILLQGGGEDFEKLFIKFRGRMPKIDYLINKYTSK